MSGADREIELKFACGPDDLAAVLAAAPKGDAGGDDETRELISVYFDTPDLALQKAGASLRVREHKGQRTQTLKRGQGLIREEHEAPIDGLAPDPGLDPLPKLLPDGATLKPAFNVRVSRRQRTLRYHEAEIELALDQGEVTGADRRSEICEVELELKSGPPAALFALARELLAVAPLYLAFDSKAARGHALVAGGGDAAQKSGKVVLTGAATVGDAFQAIARKALAQIAGNAATLRAQPGAETVHQLRVGARRLRSAFSTFKPLLDGDELEVLKAEVRWLSNSCNLARGLDVFAAQTLQPAFSDDRPAAARPAVGLHRLRKGIEAARRKAWGAAAEAAASARFRMLLLEATAWVETGAWLDGPDAKAPVRPFARQALKRHLKRVAKRGRAARGGEDEARHHLRIEAKKLRYAAEAFASLHGERRAARYVERVKALQGLLGELNDLAVAEPLIATLNLPHEAAFAAGELVGLKAAARPKMIAEAEAALDRLEAAKPFWG